MTAPATETEVVLTPFLAEVKQRAEARNFAVIADQRDGSPWLYITVPNAGTVCVFGPGHHILTADLQNLPLGQLVDRAHFVVLVAHALLDNGPADHCFACGTSHTAAEVCIPRAG